MSIRDRAISLLGQGYGNSQVAAAVGCTPSYISQLLEEDEVFQEVSALRAGKLSAAAETDTRIESLEKQALELVAAKMVFVRNPMEAVKIFSVLNGAKKKTGDAGAGNDQGGLNTVNITIPKSLSNNGTISIQLNTNNQVVEVAGRSMAPLPSRALRSLVVEDVTPKIAAAPVTENQIRDAQRQVQAKRDAARAAEILARMSTPIHCQIDGVDCVL